MYHSDMWRHFIRYVLQTLTRGNVWLVRICDFIKYLAIFDWPNFACLQMPLETCSRTCSSNGKSESVSKFESNFMTVKIFYVFFTDIWSWNLMKALLELEFWISKFKRNKHVLKLLIKQRIDLILKFYFIFLNKN